MPPRERSTFGTLLGSYLSDREQSFAGLARSLRVTPSYLSLLSVGLKPVPPQMVRRISTALGLTDAEHQALMEAVPSVRERVQLKGLPAHVRRIIERLTVAHPFVRRETWEALERDLTGGDDP